jgi:hypothetical protein
MTATFSGGCACGSIRYLCSRAPVATLNCHCPDCQRSSGAPFASGFIVRESDITITGTPKTCSVRASSGRLGVQSCDPCALEKDTSHFRPIWHSRTMTTRGQLSMLTLQSPPTRTFRANTEPK